jgi:putative YphP/YqiW family bacilliredoxin
MKAELTDSGFDELLTAAEVDSVLGQEGTTLVVINSVCGCAAGTCRPGVVMAVENSTVRPDRLATSFAGFVALSTFFSCYCPVQRWSIGKYGRTPPN